jgi:excisionase family DNA binding protein
MVFSVPYRPKRMARDDTELVAVYIEPAQLQRLLDILHDISDRLAKIEEKLTLPEPTPQPSKPIAKLLTVAEVADRLGVARGRVYELTNTKALPSIKLGSTIRVHEEDLNAFLSEHRREAADALTRDWSATGGSALNRVPTRPRPIAALDHALNLRQCPAIRAVVSAVYAGTTCY